MDKADIDYEAERDRRDMERVEEIRRITNGMFFVLKQRIDLGGGVSTLIVKSATTQLSALIQAMYKPNLYGNRWNMDYGIDKGEIQVYEDNGIKLIATLPIINIKELHLIVDKLDTVEGVLLDHIKKIRK